MFISKYSLILLLLLIITFFLREYFVFKKNLLFKYILTPLITIFIICFVILFINIKGINTYTTLILVALIFSLTADVLLMIEEVDLLKQGIVFFIGTHLLYIVAFLQNYRFHYWNISVIIFFMLIGSIFFNKVKDNLGKLFYPVLVYLVIICLMGFSAFSRFSFNMGSQTYFLIFGAVLFMLSDFLIAITVFVKPIENSTVYTWALYAPAQFLIALSCY